MNHNARNGKYKKNYIFLKYLQFRYHKSGQYINNFKTGAFNLL